ncbi:class I SAM-dependent methyltransferase [Candidatus Chlorohelix sp.]|uniref:class I SAM-dependent methyltransferase n=1 Tax=Candidatus Chlorohelix sp. TaxID=3139201 RepID=UPI00302F26E5
MPEVELLPTRCAICNTEDNATELYPANFDLQAFNPTIFSARRLPDRIHYRLVKCKRCGLVRSDPIVDPEFLSQLYALSTFTYSSEVANLKATYGHYLAKLVGCGAVKGTLLEIGCGNGFFLEEAISQGYLSVHGVEPSKEAIERAAPHVRSNIVCDIMRPNLFEPDMFDVICLFQVFDHLPDPVSLIKECYRVLKPGGLILFLNHNVAAVSAKVLGERSPVVDIEHTYLYSPTTLDKLISLHGFKVKTSGKVYNNYTLKYLTHLIPLPKFIKPRLLSMLQHSSVGRIKLSLPLGNLYVVGQKPQ